MYKRQLLDSAAVEVLLSRDDVRASRAVSGLVERAERELDHLIERQLDCLQPRSWRERLGDAARSRIASAVLAAAIHPTRRDIFVPVSRQALRAVSDTSMPRPPAYPASPSHRPESIGHTAPTGGNAPVA